LFNPLHFLLFYWSACSKPVKWNIMQLCVRRGWLCISLPLSQLIFLVFQRKYGIFCFPFHCKYTNKNTNVILVKLRLSSLIQAYVDVSGFDFPVQSLLFSCSKKVLNYLDFKLFDFARIFRRLFQKRALN
jgi:hypothetical protein